MRYKAKRALTVLFVLLFLFFCTGCSTIYKFTAPKEYRSEAENAGDYPEDTLPIYRDSIIYHYEEENTVTLTFGCEDAFEDVSEFYMDYFDDNKIFLSSEKDRSSTYLADGESGYYEFELSVEVPAEKWEERLYSSIVKIRLEEVNIPDKNKLYAYIEQVEEDFSELETIFETNTMLDESDEEDMNFYINEIDEILAALSGIDSKLSERDVPKLDDFVDLHKSETEMINILISTFRDYKEHQVYVDSFIDASIDVTAFYNTNYDYYYDAFEAIIKIFDSFARELESIPTPSSLEAFSGSLIEILDETVSTSQYCIDAIDYEDNVRFYAGLYSYDINDRDLSLAFDRFDNDDVLINDRKKKDVTKMKDIKSGISGWLQTAKAEIKKDSEKLTGLPDELKIGEEEITVSYDYHYPEYIIPANYRSLDYIAFIQLFTNKDKTNIKITAEIPGFTEKFEQITEISRAETEFKIHPPLQSGAIDSLNSNKDAQLVISVEDLDSGEFILKETNDITLYSRYDMQWYDEYDNSYVENILAWMTPEAPEISSLLRASADSVSHLTEGALDSILGYQPFGDWEDYLITYYQTAAIMHALATEKNVKYIAEPFSSTGTDLQRVKTPSQVINDQGGLCAETSVTVASALQAIGMHPVLILPPNHMQVAVETWYGSCEYFLIETTALSDAYNEDFSYVIYYFTPEEWDQYLSRDGYVVVDCDLANQFGIKSID